MTVAWVGVGLTATLIFKFTIVLLQRKLHCIAYSGHCTGQPKLGRALLSNTVYYYLMGSSSHFAWKVFGIGCDCSLLESMVRLILDFANFIQNCAI